MSGFTAINRVYSHGPKDALRERQNNRLRHVVNNDEPIAMLNSPVSWAISHPDDDSDHFGVTRAGQDSHQATSQANGNGTTKIPKTSTVLARPDSNTDQMKRVHASFLDLQEEVSAQRDHYHNIHRNLPSYDVGFVTRPQFSPNRGSNSIFRGCSSQPLVIPEPTVPRTPLRSLPAHPLFETGVVSVDDCQHMYGMYISESFLPLLYGFLSSGPCSSSKWRIYAPKTCRCSVDNSSSYADSRNNIEAAISGKHDELKDVYFAVANAPGYQSHKFGGNKLHPIQQPHSPSGSQRVADIHNNVHDGKWGMTDRIWQAEPETSLKGPKEKWEKETIGVFSPAIENGARKPRVCENTERFAVASPAAAEAHGAEEAHRGTNGRLGSVYGHQTSMHGNRKDFNDHGEQATGNLFGIRGGLYAIGNGYRGQDNADHYGVNGSSQSTASTPPNTNHHYDYDEDDDDVERDDHMAYPDTNAHNIPIPRAPEMLNNADYGLHDGIQDDPSHRHGGYRQRPSSSSSSSHDDDRVPRSP